MATLGWALNLDFAGSGSGAVAAGPVAGSMLMLGVGRTWWVPLVWQATTGTAYAGELDTMMEYVSAGLFVAAGALGAYAVTSWNAYQERKRKAKIPEKFVDDAKAPMLVGSLGGPGRVCQMCGHAADPVFLYNSGLAVCAPCRSEAK